jgi:hypothetical protein
MSPDSQHVAVNISVGGNRDLSRVILTDCKRGNFVAELEGHECFIRTLAFAPEGGLLMGAGKSYSDNAAPSVIVWEIASREHLTKYKCTDRTIDSLSFCNNGMILVTSGLSADQENGVVRLWKRASAIEMASFDIPFTRSALAVTPAGLACTVDGQTPVLWVLPEELFARVNESIVLSPGELDVAWSQLANDFENADPAFWRLATGGPQARKWLRVRLDEITSVNEESAKSLIHALGSIRFAVRERARESLLKHNATSLPILIRALENATLLDTKLSLEHIISEIKRRPVRDRTVLRWLRANRLLQLGDADLKTRRVDSSNPQPNAQTLTIGSAVAAEAQGHLRSRRFLLD